MFGSILVTEINWRELIETSAPVIGLLLTAAGLIYAATSVRAKVYMDVFNLLEGTNSSVREIREKLRKAVKELEKNSSSVSEISEKLRDAVETNTIDKLTSQDFDKLAREYDKIGHLVKHRVVSPEFLFDFYSFPIAYGWTYMSAWIAKERNRDGRQVTHMLKFETLAAGAWKYRRRKYPLDKYEKEKKLLQPAASAIREWYKWRRHGFWRF